MKKLLLCFIFLSVLNCFGRAQTAKQFYNQALKTTDLTERIKLLTKAIDKDPKFTSAYHYRADAYKDKGLFKKALADYNKIITLNPQDPFKYYARALAYIQRNDCAPAIEDLNQAIKLKSNYEDFYYNRAVCYMNLEKYAPAVKDLDKLKDPKNNTTQVAMMKGEANFFLYRYDKAVR